MTKSQLNYNWLEGIYQQKMSTQSFQSVIFTGFDFDLLSPMSIIINHFVDTIDLSFFEQYYKANNIVGGRPNFDYKVMLKIYMYALYNDISIRKLNEFNSLGSNLHFLSQGLPNFPKKSMVSKFLKTIDKHIDTIFDLSIEYICKQIDLDFSELYCDGTIFEAHNNRHKIITNANIERSNKKWTAITLDPNADEALKEIAKQKLLLNTERTLKLQKFNRTSYGRTDEDCVLLKDKPGNYIAGYNVQFVEENKHGLIVFPYISNKNLDSAVFVDMIYLLAEKYHPKNITMDTGYGTPEILTILDSLEITPIVKALKNENANKKITNYSFELSENDDSVICPVGQMLEKTKVNDKGETVFKAKNCLGCEFKNHCCPKSKVKTVTTNIDEFKLFNAAKKVVNSEAGKESYSHRGNKCESPNGFVKYNLNGKKLVRNGLEKNHTIINLYSILFNLRRMISIKSVPKN